jgi:signal transduction histidine kinase|nr:ATP-binding protein [Candidatus Krumholzibacteria bacterium]
MTWLVSQAARALGILCLLGQGFLVYAGSTVGPEPGLALPGLFLALTIVQAVVFSLELRKKLTSLDEAGRRALFLPSVFLTVAIGTMLACGLVVLSRGTGAGDSSWKDPESSSPVLAEALLALEQYPAASAALLDGVRVMRGQLESQPVKGDWFRLLAPWPEQWSRYFPAADALPGDLLVHRRGSPLAWTEGAEPLPPPPSQDVRALPVDFLTQHAGTWYLRSFVMLSSETLLEWQVPLEGPQLAHRWPGLELSVRSLNEGTLTGKVALTDSDQARQLVAQMEPGSADQAASKGRARLMILLTLGWLLGLTSWFHILAGHGVWLGSLWAGRALLAGVDFFRWFPQAFPDLTAPAPPGHPISLVGPAYFATPFASGWFASTADALLTALVVGLTAWALLRSRGLVGWTDELARAGKTRPLLGQGLVSGLVFGLVGAGLLWLAHLFASLVADNANPRLIGQGVSVGFLSFWGLHVVLMVIPFSLASLLVGWAGDRPWPERTRLGGWLAAAGLGGLVSGAVFFFLPRDWWWQPALAGLITATWWLVAPALRSRPRFLRRFAWPTVMLLVVVWNYVSLREVYDQAERSWLVSKGHLITSPGEEGTRFLLEDAMLGMRETDRLSPSTGEGVGIWRDHPAYLLWASSPLRDLGYACSVEIIDTEYGATPFFATGFMRDSGYELLSRGNWTDREGAPATDDEQLQFQTERRVYPGGEEEVLVARMGRAGDLGWIRVELPVRSWRISTLLADLRDEVPVDSGYRPRAEVDRPILLLRGDNQGWLGTGDPGLKGAQASGLLTELKQGVRPWAAIERDDGTWLCRWNPLPDNLARSPGEGFLLGLRRAGPVEDLLDLSRIMLINLVLLLVLFGLVQGTERLRLAFLPAGANRPNSQGPWLPGFQERFLAGYLMLGLLLLLVVGMSVDRVGYQRVLTESKEKTLDGLNQAISQLRSLLAEQAGAMAASEYISDLLVGEMAGQRPVGPPSRRQAMVFAGDGTLVLDETLSNLTDTEARVLLTAGRSNPLIVIRDDQQIYVATVIPVDLFAPVEGVADEDSLVLNPEPGEGFFLYRQQLDSEFLGSLADLVRGQATLYLEGQPYLASHPGPVFAGRKNLLTGPDLMASLLDHPWGPGVFPRPGRTFAFSGSQPLPVFARDEQGRLVPQPIPGVMSLAFPDREQQYNQQRRETVLFLAGLANLILLTALMLALVMSWNLFRPLRVLLTATRRLADEDFDAPLPPGGRDEVGRLAQAFGLMRGQLRTAREKLAAREKFLAGVLDQVTVGVAVVDRQGQVAALNPAGRHILTDFQPEMEEQAAVRGLVEIFRDMAAGKPTWSGEIRSADGQHTLRGAMAPLDIAGGESDTMLVFEDITEFLQTKKMAINAELARQVAHEIKNPLTPIQLSVQLLDQAWRDQHPRLDAIVPETVQRVLSQVELLRTIASEFSLLGQPGELDLVVLDLAHLVGEVTDAYQGAGAVDSDHFRVEVADCPHPLVLGERDALRKILGNLMQNSLDATRPEEPLSVQVSWRIQAGRLTLVWVDNGQGLLPEVADRLFDPYFSTKSKGTGLGLAICRNLADRMGGSMTLANRQDAPGAQATLTLPRAK